MFYDPNKMDYDKFPFKSGQFRNGWQQDEKNISQIKYDMRLLHIRLLLNRSLFSIELFVRFYEG